MWRERERGMFWAINLVLNDNDIIEFRIQSKLKVIRYISSLNHGDIHIKYYLLLEWIQIYSLIPNYKLF